MVKVKICGITSLEDAHACISSGCDALGFVFCKESPRYILPGKARKIISQLPAGIIKIGVFANSSQESLRKIARICKLDILQLHGNESPQFCARLKNYKIIKAFRVKDRVSLKNILKYRTFAYLFDAFAPRRIGGTGKRFNWKLLKHPKILKRPVFLSGGLCARNVKQAIVTVRPDWVDVSSSVEIKPGKKDHKKVRLFIKAAKRLS